MAFASLFTLLDDITAVLDDVALMTKMAAKKTAGVVGDDLALNANQVTGVSAERELPIIWAVAKGSLVNKLILVPLALLLSAFLPKLITPLLMIGGIYLCFEGVEKLLHKFLHRHEAHAGEEAGGADEGAGFEAVHLLQLRLIHGFADVGKVDGLSARHTEAAGCFGERGQHGDLAFGGQSGRTAQYVEGLGLQRVADQEGSGFVVFHMAGRFAAPQAVVVHCGHVVVDQGIDVHHFNRRHGLFDGVLVGIAQFGCGEHQERAQPFAAAEGNVTHGFVQRVRHLVFRRQETLQQQFGLRLGFLLPGFQFIRRVQGSAPSVRPHPILAAFVRLPPAWFGSI